MICVAVQEIYSGLLSTEEYRWLLLNYRGNLPKCMPCDGHRDGLAFRLNAIKTSSRIVPLTRKPSLRYHGRRLDTNDERENR